MRRKKYYKIRRRRKKEENVFHIFLKIKFIYEKDLKQVLERFSHCMSIRKRWRHYWTSMLKKKYRRKLNRKFNRKYKRKIRVGVLETDLNYYILSENSGVSQCNEAQKELCDGKTAGAEKNDFSQR